ncbi:IS1249 family transposase [Leifsonia sp. McL0607]|uniref:IS1249 family transposase n=1 Tax=Leifsonia sp. McL0607 TaxID=3415672 RepID=UPI003CFB52E5
MGTTAGTQRWRCRVCGASSTRRRPDGARRQQLRRFLIWLTGKSTQAEAGGGTGRSFRHETAWCWHLRPRMPVTGEIHDAVLVDGIRIGSWCLLIALSSTGRVISWQWSAGESTAAWEALFDQVPPPKVIVTDGGTGIRSALARAWPDTAVQRCIFHLQMNVTRELTRNPRLKAGRALRQIAMRLSSVHDVDAAIEWRLMLEAWWQQFGHLTKERTLYDNGQFGFTHHRLRKAWGVLHRAAEAGHEFTFLEHGNPHTTSPLEGGVNAQIRHLLRHHRGMTIEHRRRAVEWFLLLKEVPIESAHEYADPPASPQPRPVAEKPDGPALYDTSLDAGERLWLRSGWAGHK